MKSFNKESLAAAERESARASDLDLPGTLKELCCDPFTFMWVNSLLTLRDEIHDLETDDGNFAYMRFIYGFRLRRNFMHLKRDHVFYCCPFCKTELVIPVGYFHFGGPWVMSPPISLAKGRTPFEISKAKLQEYLAETKRRCAGVWPPKD